MALVGEQVDDGNEITGARVVDKSRGNKPIFRLELWYRDSSKKDANEMLRSKLLECLKGRRMTFESVPHKDKNW